MFRAGYLARKAAQLAADALRGRHLQLRPVPGPAGRPDPADRAGGQPLARRRSPGSREPSASTSRCAVQYLVYLRNLVTGQFGISITYRRPVADILAERMANTLILLGAATVLVVVLGIALGVCAAARRGARGSTRRRSSASLVFWSLPTFWTGLILVFIFGVCLHVLPGLRA